MTTPVAVTLRPVRSAASTVRRIVVILLLLALVIVTAIGLSGLLGRLIDPNATLVGLDPTSLALSLAFTLVGGPLTLLLWWLAWRRLDDPAERGSLAWGLYLAGASTLALIVTLNSGLTALTALIEGEWLPGEAATAVSWSAVWIWHRWMRRHRTKGPLRLGSVAGVLASWYGLIVGAVSVAGALGAVFAEAIRGLTTTVVLGEPWWRPVLQSLVWAAGGGLVWAWHWFRERVRDTSTVFASVVLVLVGILAASVAALAGAGTLVFVGLRLAFDAVEPVASLLDPLDIALAAALVGAVVWTFHARIVRARPASGGGEAVRSAASLVLSGVGVAATATAIGVIINATLASLSPTLAGAEPRTLLLSGISTLVVGAPLWWVVWRPTRGALPAAAASTGRRIYLVALFGISAAVALVALLVIGFLVFEFLLDTTGGAIVDRVRAPLGILVATLLVAGYHFAIWRRDRAVAGTTTDRARAIRRVTLVLPAEDPGLVAAVREATGSSVTVWLRASEPGAPVAAPATDAVVAALADVHAERVLVLAGPRRRIDVVPLVD